MLLLDTHAWIWTLEGDVKRIGRRTRSLVERAAARDEIRVSPVSVFEVCALHAAGRLRLPVPVEQWISGALEPSGARLAPLSREVAVDAGRIGRSVVPDPLDRLIAATARQMDAVLVTSDSALLKYAESTKSLRVQDAAR